MLKILFLQGKSYYSGENNTMNKTQTFPVSLTNLFRVCFIVLLQKVATLFFV